MPIENRAEVEQIVRAVLDRDPRLRATGVTAEVFGVATITWPGGSRTSDTVTVNHDLGVVPYALVTVVDNSGLVLTPTPDVVSRTATQLGLRATTVDGTTPAATATTTVVWRAFV